ncbi:MAG: leucine-rich repeat protein [Clostridia bacterium]|nr:leucine-rich repeat protein [Clostridia bacterium]
MQKTTTAPTFTITPASNITQTDAKIYASVNNPSRIRLVKAGFCLSTSPKPKTTTFIETVTSGYETANPLPVYYDHVSDYATLQPGTTYYYNFFVVDSNGKYYYCSDQDNTNYSFTTLPVKVTSVTVSPANVSLYIGEATTLSVSVSPSNATDKTVTWASDNASVATVNQNGRVTAVAAGTTYIRATAKDGSGKYGSAKITVLTPTPAPTTPPPTQPSDQEVYLVGQVGYEPEFDYDEDGNLLFDIYLGGLKEGDYISSIECRASWDTSKLQLTGYNHYSFATSVDPNIIPAVGSYADEGWLAFACAGSSGMSLSNESGLILTLKFKVNQSLPIGEQIWIELSNFKITLADAYNIPISSESYTTAVCDGLIVRETTDYEILVDYYNNETIITRYLGSGGDVVIPSTLCGLPVTGIDDWAFQQCYTITSITIPASVTSIDGDAFYYCTSLTSFNVSGANPNFRAVNGVLFTKDFETLVKYPLGRTASTYSVPDGTKNIFYSSFEGCPWLTSVSLPNGIMGIGSWAFCECTALESITIPYSVSTIEGSAFLGCTSLSSVVFDGAPPSVFESYVFHTYDAASQTYIPLDVTLYYYPEYAKQWAPNGETTWHGYAIREIQQQRVDYFTITNADGSTDRQYVRFTYGGGVEYEYDCITNLPPNTTAEQLARLLGANVGELSGKLKTGDTVVVDGEHFRVIIMGDVTCDGETDSKDAAELLRAVVKLTALNELQANAANTSFGSTYTSSDAAAILRFVVKLQATVGKTN